MARFASERISIVELEVESVLGMPDGVVATNHLAAGLRVPTSKQIHRRDFSYCVGGTVASIRVPLGIIHGATATIERFAVVVSQTAAVGAATVTVDLLKNGSSILSGGTPITIDNTNVATVPENGTLSSAAGVLDDVLEANIVATSGGGTLPVGLIVLCLVDEDPA